MIKVVAFDLVGVLVKEKDIKLTLEESKLERMFGSNVNDFEYLVEGKKIISDDSLLIKTTEKLIDKIYAIKDDKILKKIKERDFNLKIIIATNHVSFVKKFIFKSFGKDYLDDVLISAEIHKVKPNFNFYEHILNKHRLKPNELLFLDDNIENIESANEMGINTIKVNKETKLFEEICKFLK